MGIVSRGGGGGGGGGGARSQADGPGEAPVMTNLPPRTGPVCGRRAEMQAVVDVFNAALESSVPGRVEVCGPPGVGASTVAIELARRAGGRFPGGAWLLRADIGADLAWAEIAAARGEGVTDDLPALAARERARLSDEPKALLVVDGVGEGADFDALLPPREGLAADAFVVTQAPSGALDDVVTVAPVPHHAPRRIAHSVLTMRERADGKGGEDVEPPAVRTVDGLALTASLAARVAVAFHPKGGPMSMQDLRSTVMRLVPLVANPQPIGLELLLVCSVAHPRLISVDALYGAIVALRRGRDKTVDANDLGQGVLHLVRLGLLELEEESRVSMHPLLQEIVRGMAQSESDLEVARTALAGGLIEDAQAAGTDEGVDVRRAGLHQLRHLLPDAPEPVRGPLSEALAAVERGLALTATA